ncbi:hypothetical protein [Sphingobium subterraneum]|uniref:3-isopropylmalate/(R)-2-methylmalate dehydratase small subunit n=1 Tax=Sphingobium subterraneum TaxID=627688 RepID=A0A841JA06_9SPHN|nr:hypothetical protein [Sphingobium subterraneum]MBB6125335.1 3-isopropylmalate/(R)-2-methylmalate dehydratase small subunit [Sphingobium subterraneum]
MKLQGKSWKFGNGLGATDLVSSDYDKLGMTHDWDGCAQHLLEKVDPGFLGKMRRGDILIAGTRLGAGHAHYYMTAIMGCKHAGISGILCESVNTLFQRAAIDAGYPVWPLPGISDFVRDGDELEIDLATGMATNKTTGEIKQFTPIPELIRDILNAGNSLNWALTLAV